MSENLALQCISVASRLSEYLVWYFGSSQASKEHAMKMRLTLMTAFSLVFVAIAATTARPGYQRQAGGEQEKLTIRPGTALAKLAHESGPHDVVLTDFQKQPRLKVDIPLWLRSHYRRNHPEMRTNVRANDPTGGFPMALENLYNWML